MSRKTLTTNRVRKQSNCPFFKFDLVTRLCFYSFLVTARPDVEETKDRSQLALTGMLPTPKNESSSKAKKRKSKKSEAHEAETPRKKKKKSKSSA